MPSSIFLGCRTLYDPRVSLKLLSCRGCLFVRLDRGTGHLFWSLVSGCVE